MDSPRSTAAPIAIVGVAAELPSGEHSDVNLDHEAFFEFLLQGKEAYERIPVDRFPVEQLKGKQLGRIVAENGTFLKDITLFDHIEFGITGKDARAMAVSTRKLVELAFLALLDSGIDYRGQNIGCYTSGVGHDILSLGNMDEYEARGSFAGAPAQLANKISYHLDLLGPSIPLDTACSSTATALHLAVQAIRTGDCDAAVVGGCQLNQRFVDFIQYSQGGVLSPDGKCKPFDAGADGFSRGEAAVVIVLKPLSDALRDGDKVYATVRGTGINSTGCAAPANAPVAAAQEDAMRRAYRQAGLLPQDVDYVELHATGTALGDPTEANWVGQAFARENSDDEIVVGSVKGNIGHTEITAFLASLCKVVGIFKHKTIPPTINLSTLNPAIHWDEYKLRVPLQATALECRAGSGRSMISISSSGIGGSNAHCVLESPPDASSAIIQDSHGGCDGYPVLIAAGGLSPRSTTTICEKMSSLIKDHSGHLRQLSNLHGRRVRQMTWRSYSIVRSDLVSNIQFTAPIMTARARSVIGFVFSGQGPQHLQMGKQLFARYATFRNSILEMDATYESVVGASLLRTYGLFDPAVPSGIMTLPDTWPIEVILPAVTILQIALVDLLASFGIRPRFMLGHSAGETAALYASGAAPKSVAVRVAIARGQALSLTEGNSGTMAALSCDAVMANALINLTSADQKSIVLEIACYNSQDAVTVAGHSVAIDELVQLCKSQGIAAQKLRTNVAVHSSMMDACETKYKHLVEEAFSTCDTADLRPKIPVYSPVTKEKLKEPLDADYFWRNTRQPVRFSDAIGSALRDHQGRCVTLIEIGAHPVLSTYLSSLCTESTPIMCPMKRTRDPSPHHESTALLHCVGKFIMAGHNCVDFTSLNGTSDRSLPFSLPSYPFAKKHIPTMSKWTGQTQVLRGWNGPLNHPRLRINAATHPDLAQHVIKGEPIVPATAFMEMVLESGVNGLSNVKFHTFMSLSNDEPIPVNISIDGHHWAITSPEPCVNESSSGQPKNRLHAEGHLLAEDSSYSDRPNLDLAAVKQRCKSVNMQNFYDEFLHFAEFGSAFRLVTNLSRGKDEFLVEVTIPSDSDTCSDQYRINPTVLDACCHSVVHPRITGNTDKAVYYLPKEFRHFVIYDCSPEAMTKKLYAHGRNGAWTLDTLSYDLLIVNARGEPICEFKQFVVAMHSTAAHSTSSFDILYEALIPPMMLPKDPGAFRLRAQDCAVMQFTLDVDKIKETLTRLNPHQIKVVWFYSLAEQLAGAATGFTRSLRRELLNFRIRLAIFEEPPVVRDLESAIHSLQTLDIDEDELVIDPSGQVYVPRLRPIIPSSPFIKGIGHLEVPEAIECIKHTEGPSTPTDAELSSPIEDHLFNSGSVYFLLGGIGSLGLRIAAWMYRHGARHLILTSRSGGQSVIRGNGQLSDLRVMKYLKGLPDLDIKFLTSDTSEDSLRSIVAEVTRPIAGCILLTAVMEDGPFASQTAGSFTRAQASKTGAFEAARKVLDLPKLDFLVAFTSVSGMLGNAGQTSYSSANTALEFATRQYDNVFCFVAPAVLDSAVILTPPDSKTTNNPKIRHSTEWGMSARDVCRHLENGLRKLRRGRYWLYIPDFDWSTLVQHFGVMPQYAHLVPPSATSERGTSDEAPLEEQLLRCVLKVLEVQTSDFSPEVPLTAYGLDSLSASRLSLLIAPFVCISQLQLLADMTFSALAERAQLALQTPASTAIPEFII